MFAGYLCMNKQTNPVGYIYDNSFHFLSSITKSQKSAPAPVLSSDPSTPFSIFLFTPKNKVFVLGGFNSLSTAPCCKFAIWTMALYGTSLSFNGLSPVKEFNFLPGLFINSFQKRHDACPSPFFNQNRLVFGKSFERGNQPSVLPNQFLKLQMRRLRTQPGVKSEDSESVLSSENIALDEHTLVEELQKAIAEENYTRAAEIRDTLKSLQKDSKIEVLGLNSKFYNAFRDGDLAGMQAMWAKRDEVCCVHPGLKGISGYDDVIESWNYVWANYEFPLGIKLEDIKAHARGDMGYVTCMEFVKSKGGRWGGQFITNVFERIDGEWFICNHHASPVDI